MKGNAYLGVVFALAVGCSDDDSEARHPSEVADAGQDSSAQHEDGTDDLPRLPDAEALPIVFVHGFSGSAQQFTSQAMRFVANGYPAERLRAYEHDGAGTGVADFIPGADAVVDEVRAKFGADRVFLIGHSRGTLVSSTYLSDPARAAKVAKYIALDGGGCANIPVPCLAPAQTTNTRAGQTHPIPGQKHVEVATSKESFALQFEFLFGRAPEVLDIVKQQSPVRISGRAVNVPANTGREGTTLSIFELRANSGLRAKDEPLARFEIGADGAWGPVTVDPEAHYEFVLSSADSPYQHHFYEQPFLRSSAFIRLRSGPSDSTARMHTNTGDHHAAVTVSRMREWTAPDVLEVSTQSASGDAQAVNVLGPATGENRIAIYLHDDAATPGESSLALLPWFPEQPFQTGVDIVLPAADPADGTITLRNLPRGDADHPQLLRVGNWS
ncbi:MAG TPA: alpha/beta fold hydrolase [Polyangiales bacterium]|nr:alpha/beta fold hydrolase [Polyangiales bacterium]